MNKLPFDPIKAGFYLVAGVIALHGVVVLLGFIGCLAWFAEVQFECDKSGRLTEMLAAALAAAMAFGFAATRKGKSDDGQS